MNEQNLKPQKAGEKGHNPLGRKKGTKNFKTLYKKFLAIKCKPNEMDIDVPFVKSDKKITLKEMMILRHIKKAIGKADYKDIELIMNRIDGMLTQKTDLNSIGEIIIKLPDDLKKNDN